MNCFDDFAIIFSEAKKTTTIKFAISSIKMVEMSIKCRSGLINDKITTCKYPFLVALWKYQLLLSYTKLHACFMENPFV